MMLTADFETIVNPNYSRVWAWSTCSIDSHYSVELGNSGDSFMVYIQSFTKSAKIYFHNLKFDGEFLLYILHEWGYKHYTLDDQDENKKIPQGYYSTLISAEGGRWYSIKLCLYRKGKRQIIIEFLDSSKILPLSVAQIAKGFKLESQKLEIDYALDRPIGHKLTEKEKQYITNDVLIMAQALHIFFGMGLDKMTIGADALGSFKESFTKDQYETLFPELPYDKDVRQAYKGGFVWVKPDAKGKTVDDGLVFDVNSLYPWAMYDNRLPIGYGIPFRGPYEYDPLYDVYILQVQMQFELKDNHIPCIQLKNTPFYNGREWLESSGDHYPVICVTSVDWELIQEHYHLYNVEILGGWKFKSSKDIFKSYIDYWTKVKEESTTIDGVQDGNPAMRTIAKLMLNSLYGKFGTKAYCENKEPIFEGDILKFVNTGVRDKKPLYVPMAAFITAYARRKTITTAQKLYDRFIYSDTDSIHISGTEMPDIEVHNTHLGMWKHESTFSKARFLGAKCYAEEINQEMHVTVAGLPDSLHDQVTWDNFRIGAVYHGKLRPKHVPGGIYLEPIDYAIRER